MIQPALALTPSPAAPATPATRGAEPTVAFGAALAGVIDAAGRGGAVPLLPAAPVTANPARQPLAADGNPLPVVADPVMPPLPGSDGMSIVATPSWPPQADGASPPPPGPDLPPAPSPELVPPQGTPAPLPNHALRAGLRAAARDGADPASAPADTEQPSTDAEQAPLVATPTAPTSIAMPLLAVPVPEPVPVPVTTAVADAAPPPLPAPAAPSAGLSETPKTLGPATTPSAIPIAPRAPSPAPAPPHITDAAPLQSGIASAPPALSIAAILAPDTSAPVASTMTAVPTMIEADALARSVEDSRRITAANAPQQPQGQPQAQSPLQPGTIASAAQVFGAAIQAASRRRDEPDEPGGAPALGALAPVMTATPGVSAQPPLDMRQERWPSAMIERIDLLRDAANATDTRIRLIPDALGTIDVSVRRDGDTVHVHFAAEQAATRSLLQEAQPRLAELADARGIKLTQSNVDTGAGQQQQQQRAATPHQPSAPARARAGIATAADTDSTDTRLA
ncbi:flagellar hook-length control protein FliK [Sphingomonas sp. CFBP 13714]|uniref:flagellar hook-length control protein FliK n=1 Tax=Sphingomonas sp. CFBP 13714 TaxID=2775308 RepID=UPI00177AA04F|nr:flagellar hook-length control protein FliK [Sphingomonas sp. CFBP 13714]MBD8702106.1 flagellar hook-length control protein FliK [Sphingomonas sp. CFBP 13714]